MLSFGACVKISREQRARKTAKIKARKTAEGTRRKIKEGIKNYDS